MSIGQPEDIDPERAERFRRFIIKPDGCLLWSGCLVNNGYGSYRWAKGRMMQAHRFAWILANGPIPPGMKVLHKCDVRSCVNPDHLFLGTQQDNMKDRNAKERFGGRLQGKQVREIKRLLKESPRRGLSRELAKLYGVSPQAISQINTGKRWSHLD